MPSLVDEALDHVFQSATLSAQGRILPALYDLVEKELLHLIRQDVLVETPDKRISKYIEVRKAVETFSNKLMGNLAFMKPVATFVQRKATEQPATTISPQL